MRSDPLAYVLGSQLVPCFVDISSISRPFFHSRTMSHLLLVKDSLASIPIMTS